jgi:hypothetical protein
VVETPGAVYDVVAVIRVGAAVMVVVVVVIVVFVWMQ